MTPRVLIAHSLGWPNVARLSIAFRRAGFWVDALAPKDHPVHLMQSPERTFVYSPREPRESLLQAIVASRPQLIVPCDDRLAADLWALHGAPRNGKNRPGADWIAPLIETSLGSAKSFPLLASKRRLGELAGLPDVYIPRSDPIESFGQLSAWARTHGTPAVLKLDGSWGGQDVIFMPDARSVKTAYLKMQTQRYRPRGLRRLLLAGKIPSLGEVTKRGAGISVQVFVRGRVANCAIAAWGGEVRASVAVEVMQGESKFGVATVVRLVDGAAMIATARSIARRLELSGLYGFDFVIDELDGLPKLIEINPRATQINHLSRDGSSLPLALREALSGAPPATETRAVVSDEIALFPQEWQRDPNSPFLTSPFHDVPYEEPELVRFYGYDGLEAQLPAIGQSTMRAVGGGGGLGRGGRPHRGASRATPSN